MRSISVSTLPYLQCVAVSQTSDATGAYFRYAQLDAIPPEMTSDHVEKLLDVNDVLQGKYRVYFERNTGREPLQFYLAAFTLDVLGEFQAGGHLTNFIGYQGIVRNIWQPCYAVQAKLRAYNGVDGKKGTADDVLNALDGVTARDRGRCAIDATVRSSDFWVAKTDFFKLRSVSLSYQIPTRYLRNSVKGATFTLSGRNLFTSTKYDGADPEANDAQDAGSGLGRREYYQLPPFRTFLATLRLTF